MPEQFDFNSEVAKARARIEEKTRRSAFELLEFALKDCGYTPIWYPVDGKPCLAFRLGANENALHAGAEIVSLLEDFEQEIITKAFKNAIFLCCNTEKIITLPDVEWPKE